MESNEKVKFMYRRPFEGSKYEVMTDVLDDILIQLEQLTLRIKIIEDELHKSWTVWYSTSDSHGSKRSNRWADHDDRWKIGGTRKRSLWTQKESQVNYGKDFFQIWWNNDYPNWEGNLSGII